MSYREFIKIMHTEISNDSMEHKLLQIGVFFGTLSGILVSVIAYWMFKLLL